MRNASTGAEGGRRAIAATSAEARRFRGVAEAEPAHQPFSSSVSATSAWLAAVDSSTMAAFCWVTYSRAQAVADRAVLPVHLRGARRRGDLGRAARRRAGEDERVTVGPHRLSGPHPTETTRPALFTALWTGFATEVLRKGFEATRELRASRRVARGLPAGAAARGLGKFLVVAPDQAVARAYLDVLRGWMPAKQARRHIRLATSLERAAHEALAALRLLPEPSILVTVAMAYQGLDAPEVSVVAALTHIRSRPWLEQMIARETRVDPNVGPYEGQRALVFHPDDPLFATFRRRVETEQGTLAKRPKAARQGSLLPDWLLDRQAERGLREEGIVPLKSNALGLRLATLKPRPSFAAARPENEEPQTELYNPPSVVERRLRLRVGEMVAAQAVEDDAGSSVQRGQGRYHGCNAVLKRATCGKSRSEMTLAELDLGRIGELNNAAEHVGVDLTEQQVFF